MIIVFILTGPSSLCCGSDECMLLAKEIEYLLVVVCAALSCCLYD